MTRLLSLSFRKDSGRRLSLAAALLLSLAGLSPAAEAPRQPIGFGANFSRRDCRCGEVGHDGIFAHPPWQGLKGRVIGQFELDLAGRREPCLAFRMGIADDHGSDRGLIFRVGVDGKWIWSEFWSQAAWSDVQRVPLQAFVGRKIRLELAIDSLGEHYACWGEPEILDDGKKAFALAELADKAGKFVQPMASVPPEELPPSLRVNEEELARQAVLAVPTPQQLAWQQLEFIAFAHFGVNTFTDREWGEGKEDPKLFNPTAFDARQWVRACKDAGIRMLILTCKHHDGFCLWPSKFTRHSVASSTWKDGKGDVVKEVSDACREGGLKFGVYLSPWDRHEPTYGDSPKYNQHFINQLTELLTQYGPVTEVWFDGACGEGPNGKRQVYDWAGIYATVRKLQPDALIAICGPDIRWVGNESGVARETEWSVQPAPKGDLVKAYNGGPRETAKFVWWPAECDVSIRPGWFYHASQDNQVKTLAQLLDIYYQSVGRNSVLLLNLPPDRRGLIHENDAKRLRELRQALDETYKENLARAAKATASGGAAAAKAIDGDAATCCGWEGKAQEGKAQEWWIELDLGKETTFNRSMVQEHVAQGQRVEQYVLERWDGQAWKEFARGTTIGYKKLDRFPDVTAQKVRLRVLKSRAAPLISEMGLYKGR